VKSPIPTHGLSIRQLQQIARQIREKHLQTIAASGGHLGPGLGVVELTLALYQTLDLDHDKVIWDVGHQAYPHKLITGRTVAFTHCGKKTALPVILSCESSLITGAGHASTSISAALGMALARRQGRKI